MKSYHPKRKIFVLLLIVYVLTGIANIATAHRVYIDTNIQTFEVMEIEIEAYYGDGKAVKNGEVRVLRASGDVYLTGTTDSEGKFSFFINSTIGNETITIEVQQSGHKATYEIEVSGNVEKISLKGGESEGSIPTYQGVIAGFGYLLGLAGIASLVSAWSMKKKQEKTSPTEPKDNKTKRSIERHEPF